MTQNYSKDELPMIHNYIFFGGNCEEALEFYKKALGATVGMMLRFNESPDPVPEGMLPAGFENKVMHADFSVGSTMILASDGCSESAAHSGYSLALIVATEADADKYFNALAEEGEVRMLLTKTFWSPRYGQVTDRFGVAWMVMVAGEQ